MLALVWFGEERGSYFTPRLEVALMPSLMSDALLLPMLAWVSSDTEHLLLAGDSLMGVFECSSVCERLGSEWSYKEGIQKRKKSERLVWGIMLLHKVVRVPLLICSPLSSKGFSFWLHSQSPRQSLLSPNWGGWLVMTHTVVIGSPHMHTRVSLSIEMVPRRYHWCSYFMRGAES